MKSSFGETEKNQFALSQVPFRGIFLFTNTVNLLAYLVYTYAIFNQVDLYPWYQLGLVMAFSIHSLINLITVKNLNQTLLKFQKGSCVFVGLLHFICAILSKMGFIEYYNENQKTQDIICIIILVFFIIEIFVDILNYKFFQKILRLINGEPEERQQSESFSEDNEEEESEQKKQKLEQNDIENQQQIQTALQNESKYIEENTQRALYTTGFQHMC
ncbi:transmembrane protein, putative (macronuclear) [Tetrahymena thermophila SB210]|uniref:Transmembrane protein, putative n=1 Tax=Tetrahymena thermophila (strain SB210) TaxID=312017 RepID=Q236Q4_TETTS|nr:transmembrane protein, putative [Tetrahymena thermophila SB210]EAR92446.1 transmembrane protein, putative [Tetrahymena thermophila SB210]|eukprot:XP_001012691.1 transmembrane protein, putative [Tetrahymena thermophila SB210]